MRTGLYHDLVISSTLALPVCAIAFNMGYGVDWEPTVQFLVQHRIPTVVTGLDAAEVEFAQRAIEQDVGLVAVRFSGRNPFGSLRTLPATAPPPVDDHSGTAGDRGPAVIANNAYWLGFVGAAPP
eukprot:EG_transcript_31410